MDLATFETHARTFGASLARWPEPLRNEALELMEHSPQAQKILEEAGELDWLLDQAPLPFDAAAFADRAVRRAAKEQQSALASFVVKRHRVLAAGMAFCLFMGVGMGVGETVAQKRMMLPDARSMLFGPSHIGGISL